VVGGFASWTKDGASKLRFTTLPPTHGKSRLRSPLKVGMRLAESSTEASSRGWRASIDHDTLDPSWYMIRSLIIGSTKLDAHPTPCGGRGRGERYSLRRGWIASSGLSPRSRPTTRILNLEHQGSLRPSYCNKNAEEIDVFCTSWRIDENACSEQ